MGDNEASSMGRWLVREEEILGGFSTGAHLVAARPVAGGLPPGTAAVTLIPHAGLRYLSTDLYDALDRL